MVVHFAPLVRGQRSGLPQDCGCDAHFADIMELCRVAQFPTIASLLAKRAGEEVAVFVDPEDMVAAALVIDFRGPRQK